MAEPVSTIRLIGTVARPLIGALGRDRRRIQLGPQLGERVTPTMVSEAERLLRARGRDVPSDPIAAIQEATALAGIGESILAFEAPPGTTPPPAKAPPKPPTPITPSVILEGAAQAARRIFPLVGILFPSPMGRDEDIDEPVFGSVPEGQQGPPFPIGERYPSDPRIIITGDPIPTNIPLPAPAGQVPPRTSTPVRVADPRATDVPLPPLEPIVVTARPRPLPTPETAATQPVGAPPTRFRIPPAIQAAVTAILVQQALGGQRSFAAPGTFPPTDTRPAPPPAPDRMPAPPPILQPGFLDPVQGLGIRPSLDLAPQAQPERASPRARARECVEVRRKRQRGKCYAGFFWEGRNRTRYERWRLIDCVTGSTIRSL